MFANEVCDAAMTRLSPAERQELDREAARRGCKPSEALVAVALENLQQQLYALTASHGQRLVLVKG